MREYLNGKELLELIREIEPLKAGFDNLAFHTIITDEHANILYANQAVEEQTGFSVSEVIGKNPADLWGGHMTRDFYEDMWHAIFQEKRPFVGEVKNVRKDGTFYWQELHISPILDKLGKVRFFIGIEPNITERKEKEAFEEEFVSLLAHQLKEPLTAIKWQLALLLEGGGLTKAQEAIIQDNYKNDFLLIDLIADFLIVSKIGIVKESLEEVDLEQVVDKAIEQTKHLYPKVTINKQFSKSFLISSPTKSLIQQVFSTLLINAAKYSSAENPLVSAYLTTESGRYLFSVENNGPIIPVEEQSSIFTKLFRGSNATERNLPGTGLGLYLVRLICENLGWTVSFQSPPPGKTTTVFTLSIPTKPHIS